jgi:fructokinase
MPVICCFGEILWDIFPNEKKIGGAPLNVACRLNSFDTEVHLISRVGEDSNGEQILKYLQDQGLNLETIQIDEENPTGIVNVHLNDSNTASYTIEKPAAWDYISLDDKILKKVKSSDALIFGSLACRNQASKNTLFSLLDHSAFKVFDANLRPPNYTMGLILDLMKKSDFIKLNDEELLEICDHLNIKSPELEQRILQLAEFTGCKHICVTLGKDGAILLSEKRIYKNVGYIVKVKDTVGAGDSFLATLIHNFLLKKDPQETLDYSCAVGSLVASKTGANEPIKEEEIQALLSS